MTVRYAIYCKNYLHPRWSSFHKPVYTPSMWARFCNALGFSGRYDKQVAEIARLGAIDPAQADIDSWVKRWNLNPEIFRNRPKQVWLDSTEQRVSEIFDNRDLCAVVLDTRFNTDDAHNDSSWGSAYIWSVNDNGSSWEPAVGFTYNYFYIKEVEE